MANDTNHESLICSFDIQSAIRHMLISADERRTTHHVDTPRVDSVGTPSICL